MAKYRQIQTEFWSDGFVLDLTPEEKYFYLYIMTNSKTSQCGIYELPKRIIEMETGYNRETVDKFLKRFKEYKKIEYCDETKEIMILNWLKYNQPNNTNAIKCVNKELKEVKNREFIMRFYYQCLNYDLNIGGIFEGIGINDPKEIKKNNEQGENTHIGDLQGACKGLASKEVISNKEEVISKKQEAEVISNKENITSKDKKIGVATVTLKDVFVFFKKNMYKPKELEYKKIIEWANKISCDVIIMAIEEAVDYNGKTLKYLENIINNWCKKGIDTPQKVVQYKKSWIKKRGTSKKTSAWDYSGQREYDVEKLEKGLLGWDEKCV